MKGSVFVVQGSAGLWDEHVEWIVGFRQEHKTALEWARRLNSLVKQLEYADLEHLSESIDGDEHWQRTRQRMIEVIKRADPAFEIGAAYNVPEIKELRSKLPPKSFRGVRGR